MVSEKSKRSIQIKRKLNFLCICNEGRVRSRNLASNLTLFRNDAISRGFRNAIQDFNFKSKECDWADIIIILSEHYQTVYDLIPAQYKEKVVRYEIGFDIWDDPTAPHLTEKNLEFIQKNDYHVNAEPWVKQALDLKFGKDRTKQL